MRIIRDPKRLNLRRALICLDPIQFRQLICAGKI